MKEIEGKLFVTRNIKIIDMLKSQLLSNVADLYAGMNEDSDSYEKRNEIFANLIIINYALASRLGISPAALDMNAIKKLKIGALDDENIIRQEAAELLRHLKSRA